MFGEKLFMKKWMNSEDDDDGHNEDDDSDSGGSEDLEVWVVLIKYILPCS